MNKKLKRTMTFAFAVGMLFTMRPATKHTNLFTTEAYAASENADKLKSLELETLDADSLDLYEDSNYNDKLSDNLYVGDIYFVKTSADDIKITGIRGANTSNVRIFVGNSDKAYNIGSDISLSKGTTTILKVRVYDEKYYKDQYHSKSNYNPYTIIVKNTNAEVVQQANQFSRN
ncbi:hypothetical protein [Clostridium beijerinckii]|uniref:hypothetical protein n=1 Tax=Clostridium beijerinckii TaxID=1520 RepID=UPI0004797E93|nr:hypothetical protein [Clostridium beijerinckii]